MHLKLTLITIFIGGLGGVIAWSIGAPAPFLTGPASLVTIATVCGINCTVNVNVKNTAFIVIGISIGSNVSPEILKAATSWPISLAGMVLNVLALLYIGKLIFGKLFDFDSRSALLTSCPGLLSYVLSLSEETKSPTMLISVIQSIRVLTLTLAVPTTIAIFTDYDFSTSPPEFYSLSLIHLSFLILVSIGLGSVIIRLKLPAPFLLGGMLCSTLFHVLDITPGILPEFASISAFVILGSLIGSRFSGIDRNQLKSSVFKGAAFTIFGLIISILSAHLVSSLTGFPFTDVLVAFAPGGLETMIAMGAIVNADPTFVAFHHLSRLFLLSAMIPFLIRDKK